MTTRGEGERLTVTPAKGRPMLSWVGKRPLREVRAFPAQLVERFAPEVAAGALAAETDWAGWPAGYDHGGLLFHGDNKEVLAHLLADGFRGKVDLVYITRRSTPVRTTFAGSSSGAPAGPRASMARPTRWASRSSTRTSGRTTPTSSSCTSGSS